MSNSAFTPTFAQNLQDASATQSGLVNTSSQTFAGAKTFQDAPVIGNASGIAAASGSAPGVVTTTAQTFAGKKTLDGGAAIKGDTSGSAIAAGYVGEVKETSKTNIGTINISANTWTNLLDGVGSTATLSLGKGIWLITGQVLLGGNISTSDNLKKVAISEYSGTTTTDHGTGKNEIYCTNPTASNDGIGAMSFYVNNSTDKTYYLKTILAVAANLAVYRFNFTAVRIA